METRRASVLCRPGGGADPADPHCAGGRSLDCAHRAGRRPAAGAVPVRAGGKYSGLGPGFSGGWSAPSAAGAASEPGTAALGGCPTAYQLPAPDRSDLLCGQPQLSGRLLHLHAADGGRSRMGLPAGVLGGAPSAAGDGGGLSGEAVRRAADSAGGLRRPAGVRRRSPGERGGHGDQRFPTGLDPLSGGGVGPGAVWWS